VTFAVDLPIDRSFLGTNLITYRITGGRSCVFGDILPHLAINDHSTDHVRPVKGVIIDDGEDLSLDTDLRGCVRQDTVRAEYTIIEGVVWY